MPPCPSYQLYKLLNCWNNSLHIFSQLDFVLGLKSDETSPFAPTFHILRLQHFNKSSRIPVLTMNKNKKESSYRVVGDLLLYHNSRNIIVICEIRLECIRLDMIYMIVCNVYLYVDYNIYRITGCFIIRYVSSG